MELDLSSYPYLSDEVLATVPGFANTNPTGSVRLGWLDGVLNIRCQRMLLSLCEDHPQLTFHYQIDDPTLLLPVLQKRISGNPKFIQQ